MTPKDFKLDIALSRARAQRMMAVSAVVHVLIVAWLVWFPPVTREHWDPITEIAVINAEDLVAPEPEPVPGDRNPWRSLLRLPNRRPRRASPSAKRRHPPRRRRRRASRPAPAAARGPRKSPRRCRPGISCAVSTR
jgi:hypothetical protein